MTAFLLTLNKADQFIDLGYQQAVAPQNLPGVIQSHFGAVDQPVGFGQGIDDVDREIVALQGDDIDTSRPRRGPFDEHKRRHIMVNSTQPTDETVAADGCVVMDRSAPCQGSVVVNMDVATEQSPVGHDDAVAKPAVVRHVAAGHEEIVVTDRSDPFFLFACPVDRNALTDDVVATDDNVRLRPGVADVLRFATDDAADAAKMRCRPRERGAVNSLSAIILVAM